MTAGLSFPFGVYSVSSMELGTVTHSPWIHRIGLTEGCLALVTWCLVFGARLVLLPRRQVRAPLAGHAP
jgi:tellurite resistance protein TehA-like permease